jgi:transcriptional regulator with XRE-family HTH domain
VLAVSFTRPMEEVIVITARRSPVVRRRRLGIELRRLREAAGLTIDQVADALECSNSKISRIETGQVRATPRDVRDILELYQVAADQRDALIQIAREAREKAWWQAYGNVPDVAYVGFEAAAASILTYEALLVPGLLQTEDYARAIMRAARPDVPLDEIERRVELRMARQALLTSNDSPVLWAVLDEGVLRRQVHSQRTTRDQLHRLIEAAGRPNVTLQVLPFIAGEHGGMAGGAFTILGFPDANDPDVVYLEHIPRDLYLENPEEVKQYSIVFDELRAIALSPDDSRRFLMALAQEL